MTNPHLKDVLDENVLAREKQEAEYYDLIRHKSFRKRLVRQIERDFFTSRLGNCRHVLELGCGTGELTAAIAPGREIVAIDINDKMLAVSRLKLQTAPVKFLKLNMFHLDRLTIAFDAIVASRSFLHLNQASLEQMLRLSAAKLQIGGKILFDVQRPNFIQRFVRKVNRRKLATYHYQTEELHELLRKVPELKMVELRYMNHYFPLLSTAVLPGSMANGRLAYALRRIDALLGSVPASAMRLGVVCERQ